MSDDFYSGYYSKPAPLCLAIKWFGEDPMPHVCRLKRDHSGDHATAVYFHQHEPTTWEDES